MASAKTHRARRHDASSHPDAVLVPAAPALHERTPPTRVIAAPDDATRPRPRVEGLPDLLTTRGVYGAIALIFAAFGAALPVAFAVDRSVHMDMVGGLLCLLLYAVLAWIVIGCIRMIRNAGAWFVVDETGFRYGSGARRDRAAGETRVDWADIVCNPNERNDVTTEFTTRRSVVRTMLFWRRLPTGEVVQDELPLRLCDGVRCLRLRNGGAVWSALLENMARCPDLRFDAQVFVDVGVDPESWLPMRAPRRIGYLFVILLCALTWGFIYRYALVWPIWLVLTLGCAIPIVLIVVVTIVWARRYPGLTGTIGFAQKT